MAQSALDLAWRGLDAFKKVGAFGSDYPVNLRRFFAPYDDVHAALVSLVKACRVSLTAAMYGWDDDEIDALFGEKLQTEHLPVSLSLDSSQASGAHEKAILAKGWHQQAGNSIAIGESARHAISHDKMIVIDGLVTVAGSTNLSASGESKQNNELTVIHDPVVAAEASARIAVVHDVMLAQMAAAHG